MPRLDVTRPVALQKVQGKVQDDAYLSGADLKALRGRYQLVNPWGEPGSFAIFLGDKKIVWQGGLRGNWEVKEEGGHFYLEVNDGCWRKVKAFFRPPEGDTLILRADDSDDVFKLVKQSDEHLESLRSANPSLTHSDPMKDPLVDASCLWSTIREPLHAEFIVKGDPRIRKCIFLPLGKVKDADTAQTILKHWQLPRPNLMVELSDNGYCAEHFLTNKMIESSEDFRKYREMHDDTPSLDEERKGRLGEKCQSEGCDCLAVRESKYCCRLCEKEPRKHAMHCQQIEVKTGCPSLLKTMNRVFYERLLRIMTSVVTAVESSNSWFLSRAGVYVQGNHKLLNDAVRSMGASATVLVTADPFPGRDSVDRLFDTGGNAGCFNMELSHRLLEKARPLKASVEPVTLDCDRVWQLVGEDFAKPCGWCFPGGTHYIFAPDISQFNTAHFSASPPGLFFAGGDSFHSKIQLIKAMEGHRPAIVIRHTKDTADEYACMLERMHEKPETRVDPSKETFQVDVRRMWQEINDISQNKVTSLSDAFNVFELSRLHPRLFTDIIVAVNPMRSTPEQVLKSLSSSYNSAMLDDTEVGAGVADKAVVVSTWQVHRVFNESHTLQSSRDTFIFSTSVAVTFLAICMAVAVPFLEASEWASDWTHTPGWSYADFVVILLPALGTLVNTFMMSTNYDQKSAQLHLALVRLETETYRFRMRADPYTLTAKGAKDAAAHGAELELDKTSNTSSILTRNVRMRFESQVEAITKDVQAGEMAMDALVPAKSGQDVEDGMSHEELSAYVDKCIYKGPGGPAASGCCCCAASSALQDDASPTRKGGLYTPMTSLLEEEEKEENAHRYADDYVGFLSNEAYVGCRIVPLLRRTKKEARALSFALHSLNLLMFIAGTAATLMAAVNKTLKIWVPVCVALGAAFQNISKHNKYKERLAATNTAVSTLTNCLTFWNSLGIVERRVHSTTERLVGDVEDAMMQIATVRTGLLNAMPARAKAEANAKTAQDAKKAK